MAKPQSSSVDVTLDAPKKPVNSPGILSDDHQKNPPVRPFSKKLLDSYLQTSQSTPANPARPSKIRPLGDLAELAPDTTLPSARIKELGSIQTVLQDHSSAPDQDPDTDKNNFYDQKNLFPQSESSKPKDTQAFSTTSKAKPDPFRNLALIILGVFGIGAAVFGLNQFIKNANLNFASEGNQSATVPPRILTFQGRLADFDQNSVTDPKNMRFTMFNTSGGNTPPPVGGEILWDSNLCQISPNQSGIFTVNLGAGNGQGNDDFNCGVTLGNIFAENSNVWLQITVGNEILFPRQLIKSVPYALNSETLQGFPASQSATANTVPVLDADGNLKFGTDNTSIINLGQLNLVSQTGDIYLLPGGGNVYIGNHEYPTNLIVSGDASISGSLNLASSSAVLYGPDNLNFKTQVGQDLWQNTLTLTQKGFLGLGTETPSQQLSLNQGSINFDFANGPNLGNLKLSQDITDPNALTRIHAPEDSPRLQVLDQGTSELGSGRYQYAYTYVTQNGTETGLSPLSSIDVSANNRSVLIQNVHTHSLPSIVARNIYRTKNGSDEFYFLKTIYDNISTTTIDTLNDTGLTQLAANLGETGNYRYKVTYVTDQGETNASPASANLKITGDGRVVKIENIPLAPPETQLTARNIYRTLADSNIYHLVATISDNSTTTIYDNLSDQSLVSKTSLQSGGGVYTNGRLALQFNPDGSLNTTGKVTADGRVETAHGDNQGLKLPTSLGKPFTKVGQQIGDIVYDSVGQTLYIYNGHDFVATGLQQTNPDLTNSSNCSGNLCRLVLEPEYAGAVITGDSTDNNGTFSSGNELLIDNYRFNYYEWTSSEVTALQDFDTTVNLAIPNNFSSWQDNALTLDFLTKSADPDENNLSLTVSRGGNALTINKPNQVSTTANQWMSFANHTAPAIISSADLTTLGFQPGDTLTLNIKTASKNNNPVKISQLNLNYLSADGVIGTGTSSVWKQLAGVIFPEQTTADFALGGDSTASAKFAFLNLGSGTPTFQVRGNLFLDNPTKNNYLDLAESSSFNIRTLNSDQTATQRFTILPNGNIGIGTSNPTEKLEVAGNVKIDGSLKLTPMSLAQAGSCDSNNEGKIYFDINQSSFFACQATDPSRVTFAWTQLN